MSSQIYNTRLTIEGKEERVAIYAESEADALDQLEKVLAEDGITINREKVKFTVMTPEEYKASLP